MIYFARTETGSIKIGTTVRLDERLKKLTMRFGRIELLATMPGDYEEERAIHERFSHLRYKQSEQFQPARELMEFIGRPELTHPSPGDVAVRRAKTVVPLWARKDTYYGIQRAPLDLPFADYELGKRIAEANGLSMAAYVRQAILKQIRSDAEQLEGKK